MRVSQLSSLAHRGIIGSLSTTLPLPVTGNFHNGQTMCHSDINSAKTCRISTILVKFLALTRITSPGKNLINTRSDPPPPSIVYRNLPVRTPCWYVALINFPFKYHHPTTPPGGLTGRNFAVGAPWLIPCIRYDSDSDVSKGVILIFFISNEHQIMKNDCDSIRDQKKQWKVETNRVKKKRGMKKECNIDIWYTRRQVAGKKLEWNHMM